VTTLGVTVFAGETTKVLVIDCESQLVDVPPFFPATFWWIILEVSS